MRNARRSALSAQDESALAEAVQAGVAMHRRGRLDEAERLYSDVLLRAPRHFDALHLLGVLMQQRGRTAQALRLIGAALEVNDRSADAFSNHGKALLLAGRPDDALGSLDKALALKSDHLVALVSRATALIELGRFADAVAAADTALQADERNTDAWVKRGTALAALNDHAQAVASYDRALALNPRKADALNNRGLALGELGRAEEALQTYDALLAIEPDHLDGLINRGHALVELEREPEALEDYQRALALKDDPDAAFNDGINRLRLGDLGGWQGYEQRFATRLHAQLPRDDRHPRWQGEHVDTLLVRGEQGLGEHMLFAGLLPDLLPRVRMLVIEVEPRLVPLFGRSFPGVIVVPRGGDLPDGISAQIPLGSLGQYLRATWDAFPRRTDGHLRCDPALAARLRERLIAGDRGGRRIVGLSWHSRNPKHEGSKSAALREFAPLLKRDGCRFVDLQYGDTSADRTAVERTLGIRVEHLDDIDNTGDLDSLAALIGACDLVVTVSNTTAHLAGALGVETVVLIPAGRGRMWFWFKDRDDSPWYPRVRLRRQRRGQSWTDVVAGVAEELAHVPEKWEPVFRKEHAQKEIQP